MVCTWTVPLFWSVHFKNTKPWYSVVYISNINTDTNIAPYTIALVKLKCTQIPVIKKINYLRSAICFI